MDKTYNPEAIEQHWYQTWEKNGWFSPSGRGEAYSIMIPPPNVTGSLHMGHAFQHAIMDALVRYRRMKGRNTLWQVGTDHAGIATQMIVERKLLNEEQKTRHDEGREAFIDRIWGWKKESGGLITKQMRRLGTSTDWPGERFTMDEDFCGAVNEAFVRLYEDGLIYRGKRLVNWDPQLSTALSDLEVENREKQGHMWYLRYSLADGQKTAEGESHILIATTRPETLLGDSAVAVHPDDPAWQDLIGKEVIVPLVNRRVSIVADHYVDREKGTGCVKMTPAHDFNDYEVGKRCGLALINVMTTDGKIRARAEAFALDGSPLTGIDTALPADLQGLDRFAARKAIVARLEQEGLLEKVENHTLMVPYGDRSGAVVEPLLTDQWFVRTQALAGPAIEAVEKGRIQFVPKQYENMYFAWMRDIQDWCISRQLWWGHRIPAWYGADGEIYIGRSESEVRTKHGLADHIELRQDEDVLDTWFSSALWTFATQGWPEQSERLHTFHPSDVLVTGFDIIFFWVARMIMMSLHLLRDEKGHRQVPFRYVYVTGLIRDENGEKMSKSKGNVIDPLDMIDGIAVDELVAKRCANLMQPQKAAGIAKRTRKTFPDGIGAHGTDALRYTLYSLASTGRDINWDMKRLEGYRNFCNKIWNAVQYVLANCENEELGAPLLPAAANNSAGMALPERWIRSRLQHVIAKIESSINSFRLDHATSTLYGFIWNDFCAWYLELSKSVLNSDEATATEKATTRRTLVEVAEVAMRLTHPFMPFLTEEIWQRLKPLLQLSGETVMNASYPVADRTWLDLPAEKDMDWLQGVVTAIRTIRAQMNIGPGVRLPLLLRTPKPQDRNRFEQTAAWLSSLARLQSVSLLEEGQPSPACSTALVGETEVLIPMANLIDRDQELARLNRELSRTEEQIGRIEGKLTNAQFVQKAPAAVIDRERAKLDELSVAKSTLAEKIEVISTL